MTKNKLWGALIGLVSLTALVPMALAQDAAASGITASEVVAAHGFEHGRAVNPGTTFTQADARVYIAISIDNGTGAEGEITVQFQRADLPVGTGVGSTHLTIPAARHYHTVARTGARAGSWRAVVRDSAGTVIGQVEFTVTP